jgi:xanthine dehydrogenase accessory factor
MNADSIMPPGEHPLDVLSFAVARQAAGERCALVVVTATEGGAVRAPGALMAVTQAGARCGYVSGGCIDEDVALQAVETLEDNAPRRLVYGKGSPFMDIRLPCGGRIDLLALPDPDREVMAGGAETLLQRRQIRLGFSEAGLEPGHAAGEGAFIAAYRPKLSIRLAGRGRDPAALARIASAAGIAVALWSPERATLDELAGLPGVRTRRLETPAAIPPAADDRETAFLLMFHDPDWEPALLESALGGEAFYIGAVGSRATHARRCEGLRARGLSDAQIARIHGPVGLVPSLRDASMLAISALAEIVAAYHAQAPE